MNHALLAKGSRKVEVYNRTFNNLAEVAEFYGIEFSHLSNRIYIKGYELEKAIEELQQAGVIFKGKKYELLSLEYDIDSSIVSSRLPKGWILEEALTRPTWSYIL